MDGMSSELIDWLKQQISDRGWSVRETARRAGLSPTPVNLILSGKANPSLDVYRGLAEAFDIPLDHILRLAGEILPPLEAQRTENSLLNEGCLLLSRLPSDDLATAVRFLRGLRLTAEKEELPVPAEEDEPAPAHVMEPLAEAAAGDDQVGLLRRTLANVLVSLLDRMHPEDVRAVYDHMKDVRDGAVDTDVYVARGESSASPQSSGH